MNAGILLASNNEHKHDELRALLAPHGITVLVPRDLGLVLEVEESGSSFSENAILKAEAFCSASRLPSLADDSGLVVDALGGEPGVLSARYGGPRQTDAGRSALVLERLRGVPRSERTASFVAAVAVTLPAHPTRVFVGRVSGMIAEEAAGTQGFGYDPIFYYPPAGQTFGQMSREEKSRVSHRGRALRLAAEYLTGLRQDGILCQSQWHEEQ